MKPSLHEELDALVLRHLRLGAAIQEVYQVLITKANDLTKSAPYVQAVLDARATNGGQDLD